MRKFYTLLPVSIRNRIYSAIAREVKQNEARRYKEIEDAIPQIELKAEHIKNLRVLTNKTALLDVLPKHAIVAEIGVSRGDYSEKILSVTHPKQLHLIDSWTAEFYKGRGEIVKNRFEKEIKVGQVIIHQGFSTTELEKFDDGHFDWVYIDTNHTYQTTAKELEIASRKVKAGGIIGGHDYTIGAWSTRVSRYGVIEAVHEFCTKYQWEMVYLTHENNRCLSFALKQMP